jgi:hypothetical protein
MREMTLTPRQWRHVLYCTAEELRERRAGKAPGVRPWNAELVRAVELELAVSLSGQENSTRAAELTYDDPIGSEQAAAILCWHVRTVRRRWEDIGGKKVGRKLVFRESVVRQYAEALTDGRTAG